MTTLKQFLKKSFYTLAGLPLLHHLGNPWRGRACVLCYHRVMPDEKFEKDNSPFSSLIMQTSWFAEQMEFLAKKQQVVSLDRLVEHLERDSNRFLVAVTFDDGYKDNLVHALPILEKYNIPATIYITTRFPEGDTWMWWHEIWDYLKEIKVLEVSFEDQCKKWNTANLKQKTDCFRELSEMIMKLSGKWQREMVENLTKKKERKQYPHLFLNWDEIKILDQHPLVSIGAHTHSHPNLKILTEEGVLSEMIQCKDLLEEQLEHSIEHFAYPFGSANEADIREFKLASRCGFRSAVTTRPEIIRSPPLIAIPRLGVTPFLTKQGMNGKLSGWNHLFRKFFP